LFTHEPHFIMFMHWNVQACSLGMPLTQPPWPDAVDIDPDIWLDMEPVIVPLEVGLPELV
jgi:hypothetical protein